MRIGAPAQGRSTSGDDWAAVGIIFSSQGGGPGWTYLGCFVDQKERDMGDDAINSNNHGDLGPAATVQMCANFCRDGQFRYAAVQYYSHCVRALALSVCKLTHANPRALPSVLRQRLRGIRRVGRLGVQHRVQR